MWKKIPKTSKHKYISGWEALNIPINNKGAVDWHPVQYFHTDTPNQYINLYDGDNILGYIGISKKHISFPSNELVYIADTTRAIIDILITVEQDFMIKSLYDCRYDFLNEVDENVLWERIIYLIKNNHPKKDRLSMFLKKEFPVRFKLDKVSEDIDLDESTNTDIYTLEELMQMKIIAFANKDKIRDFYDISYYLTNNPEVFTDDMLLAIKNILDYKNLDELESLLNIEFKEHNLKNIDSEYFVLNTYNTIENLILDRDIINKQQKVSDFVLSLDNKNINIDSKIIKGG